MKDINFSDVTLLVTHYNRSSSLEKLLDSFAAREIYFKDIIVSDDCSTVEHIEKLQSLQQKNNFKLVTTPVNKGLGNNINKGQDEINSPYTLYVQEDFEPSILFKDYLFRAVEIMKAEAQWDIIRFYSFHWAQYPYLEEYKHGFSEMMYKPSLLYNNHLKFYLYSDHPHLRRNTFFSKFGRYVEGKKGDVTEYSMCLGFLRKGGRGLIATNPNILFVHENSDVEPSTMVRSSIRVSTPPILKALRYFYLKYKVLKSTFKLLLMK